MKFHTYSYSNLSTRIEASIFSKNEGVTEIQACVHITDNKLLYSNQLDALFASVDMFLEEDEIRGSDLVIKRYFLSDAANQSASLFERENIDESNISVVQQPPLDGSKIALWLYLRKGELNQSYSHHWSANNFKTEGDAERQMSLLFEEYNSKLSKQSMSVASNCIRTWLFIQNVDVNYAGTMKARNSCFDKWGLTKDTHFIASTGIEGRQASCQSLVSLDAYAVNGLRDEQIKYLHAYTHLSPTHIYGIAFERGTAIEYGDRKHLFISGTASIDDKGDVVHIGDVEKQAIRMCENVEVLLKEGGGNLGDVAQAIIYLRDYSDYNLIRTIIDSKFPNTPKQFVYAPVCRPTWLIEMECIAIVDNNNSLYFTL